MPRARLILPCVFSADPVAESAFDTVKIVFDDDVGDGLGVGFVDGFSNPDARVEFVVDLDRADEHAVSAACALLFVDVSGVLGDGDGEISDLTFDLFNFGEGEDGYIRVPGDLGHLRRKDAHRTVVGREGFVEHGHVAADGGFALDQIDMDVVIGDVHGALDAGDASANDNNVLHGDTSAQGRRRWRRF